MIKSNLHTHTRYSDGRDTPEEMIGAALERGFGVLGFSDHGYTAFDTDYCLAKGEEAAYRREILSLKEKYKGRIDLFLGLELDADGEYPAEPYDYLIGSVHYLCRGGEYYPLDQSAHAQRRLVDDCFDGSFTEMAKAYFDRVTESVIARKPDIIGHFDLITKYSLCDEEDPAYRDAALDAVREIMKHCTRFELNTGAIARGLRTSPYPADFIVREICRLGGKIVIGSDCHDARKLDLWYSEAVAYLREIGFATISRLTDHGFVEDSLD